MAVGNLKVFEEIALAFARFLDSVRTAGRIRVPLKYVQLGDQMFLVDGHHRTRAARELGLKSIHAERVELPFRGYRGIQDLFQGER